MHTPQIIVIVLISMNFGIELIKHGQPKEGNHNVFIKLIDVGVLVGLLIWGGFFSK